MRSLMANITAVVLAAVALPLVTGQIGAAKPRWTVEDEAAIGYCQLSYDDVEAGTSNCDA